MSSPYYVPSGRLPLRALVLTLACVPLVVGAAWLYAWLPLNVPLWFVTCFAMMCLATGMGTVMERVARLGKARNPVWMGRLGLFVGLVGWHAQWVAWVALQSPENEAGSVFFALLGEPRLVIQLVPALSDTWVRSIAGIELGSTAMAVLWVAEFALLVSFPRGLARSAAEAPFCEATQTWATTWEVPRKFAPIDEPAVLVHRLESHPEQLLSLLTACTDDDPLRYAELTLYRAGPDAFMSIDNVQLDRGGKTEKKRTRSVIQYLRLVGIDADEFLLYCTKPAAPAAAADDPPELVTAIDALTSGRFQEALTGAMPHTAAVPDGLRIDALRLCAMASMQLGRWDESLRYWRRLYDEESCAVNALHVATGHAMTGNAAEGDQWLATARELNQVSGELPGSRILTNFISALAQSGQMAHALPYLDEMRTLYLTPGATDPTRLFVRRVPLFHAFLDNSLPIIGAVLGADEGRAWYASMLPHLDEAGQQELTAWLDQHFVHMTSTDPAQA